MLLKYVLGCCLAEIELPNAPTNLDDVPVFKEKCDKFGKSDTYDRLKVKNALFCDCLVFKFAYL